MPTSSAPGNVAPAPGFGDLSSLPEMEPIDAAIKAHDWTRAEAALAELDPSDAGFALMGIAEIDEVERLLESAVEPDSGSPWAATALAARWIVIGWSARGGAPASDVSPEQFANFHEWARKAELLLIDVCARHPSFTPAWATRLLTARALELGASEARRRYRRLAAHVPDDFWAQQQLLQHISAKWFGSDEAAAAFAHDTAAASPPGSHSGAILALHHIEMWLAAGAGAPGREYLRRPEVLDELRQAARHSVLHESHRMTALGVQAHSAFAMAFWLGWHHSDAAVHFRALDGRSTRFPWEYAVQDAAGLERVRTQVLAKAEKEEGAK